MDLTTRFHRMNIWGIIFFTLLSLTIVNVSTMAQSDCYPHDTAYVVGNMNIRESATTDSPIVANARAGDSFGVSESQQGDSWCWLNIGRGWMAKTSRVRSTEPSVTSASQPQSDIDNCCFIGWDCDADEEWTNGYWAFQNDQCDSPSQRQGQQQWNPYPVRVTRDPFTRVTVFEYEDGSEIIARPPTQEELCEALEAADLPLPSYCEEDDN